MQKSVSMPNKVDIRMRSLLGHQLSSLTYDNFNIILQILHKYE